MECSAWRSEQTRPPALPAHCTGFVRVPLPQIRGRAVPELQKDAGVHGFNDFWPDRVMMSPQGHGESREVTEGKR